MVIVLPSCWPSRPTKQPTKCVPGPPAHSPEDRGIPPPNHPCRWVEPSLRGRRPGPRESSPSRRGRATRRGRMSQSDGGGRRAALGEGTLRESQARRGHPQPPTQVPLPRHSHDGHPRAHGHQGRRNPRAAASPFNGGHRAHPRTTSGTAHATVWGEPAASPPAELYRRGTATVSRALARPYPAAWVRI